MKNLLFNTLLGLIVFISQSVVTHAQILHYEGAEKLGMATGAALEVGKIYVTGEGEEFVFSPIEGVTLTVGSNSSIELTSVDKEGDLPSASVFLHEGLAYIDITEKGKVNFSITSPGQSTTAMGTSWATSYDSKTGIKQIFVSSGTIRVETANGNRVGITAGEIAIVDAEDKTIVYRSIGEVPQDQRADLLALINESNRIIDLARNAGIDLQNAFASETEEVSITVNEPQPNNDNGQPEISGF